MKNNKRKMWGVVFFSLLFVGAMLIQSCASSKPGFNKSGKSKGSKVRSSGKMY